MALCKTNNCSQRVLFDPVDTPLAHAGDLQAEYLAALVSDEESDSAANTLAPQISSLSRPSSSRATLEGRGSAARGREQPSAPILASAPATPRAQFENGASAQHQEQQQQGQQGPVTPARPQLPPQHSQSAPQPNPVTPAHLVQGYSFDCVGEIAGGLTPIFLLEEMAVLNMECRVYTGLGPELAGKSDLIGNYNCARLQDDANFIVSIGEEGGVSPYVPEINPSAIDCSNCA
ncbi:hypothetical protein KEM55_003419 [Ascosphaera atra]|nr:hypothetical protein KEM55_003419 [Ascosphaera atra]